MVKSVPVSKMFQGDGIVARKATSTPPAVPSLAYNWSSGRARERFGRPRQWSVCSWLIRTASSSPTSRSICFRRCRSMRRLIPASLRMRVSPAAR